MGLIGTAGKSASKWSVWGRVMIIAELALIAKRHLENLDPGEAGELRQLLVKSKGRPGNLTARERSRVKELVSKLEPGAFAKSAAQTSTPFGRRKA
ncbi:MAG: hypothetical protein R2718_11565 [Solirubrobacterales bacterium]|nr:hypothetical protein [Solirubrobacterales bacterium]